MEALDDLSQTMEEGFAGVNRRIDKLFYLQILYWIGLAAALIAHAV
ncbi:MAG TPA: hypothetical protein VFJ65_03330 [Solirubrobacterales bacterium]|nr:hypothetical protein [Solirubrobacterales bacterium]